MDVNDDRPQEDARQHVLAALDRKSKPIQRMGYRVRLQECETPHFLTHVVVEKSGHRINIYIWTDGALALGFQTFAKPRPGRTVASCSGWLGDAEQLSEALRSTGSCCFRLGESLAEERRTPLVNAWSAFVSDAGWAFF
jgi:hypothetical protein